MLVQKLEDFSRLAVCVVEMEYPHRGNDQLEESKEYVNSRRMVMITLPHWPLDA